MPVTNEQWKALYDAARTELAARAAIAKAVPR
jgi:hypothetical protein